MEYNDGYADKYCTSATNLPCLEYLLRNQMHRVTVLGLKDLHVPLNELRRPPFQSSIDRNLLLHAIRPLPHSCNALLLKGVEVCYQWLDLVRPDQLYNLTKLLRTQGALYSMRYAKQCHHPK